MILCFFAAWLAGLLRVKTKEGVLVIENIPASAAVEVDGNRVTVTPTEGEPVRIEVPAGTHHVVVKRGKDELLGETVTLESGKELKLTVKREPPARLAMGNADGIEPNQTPSAGAGMNGMAGMMGSMSDMMKRMRGGQPTDESAAGSEKGGMAGTRGAANRQDGASTGMMGGDSEMARMMGQMSGRGSMTGMMGGGTSLTPDEKRDDVSPRTKAVLAKLDRRLAMNFPKRTPLREVLVYVREATKKRNEPGMPIYVDLAQVAHAEKALNSRVTFDEPNGPLKGSLDLILKQVGLAYCVKDGLLVISTPSGVEAEKEVPAAAPSDDAPRSQAIAAKLAEPLAIKFCDGTPLQDALRVIKGTSIGPKVPSMQIYVNPAVYSDKAELMMGSSHTAKPAGSAEKTKPLLVTMDVENVPLRTTLRLLLAQAGLEFSLKKGILIINRKMETGGSMMGMMGMMGGGRMGGTMPGGSMMGVMAGMGGMMGQNPDDLEPRTKAAAARLDQPIPMNFPRSRPLRDVLRYVRESINVPNEPAIPIYFDPVGIGDTEKAQNAIVSIDLNDIPLNDTLELLFEQAGLAHCVRDGLIFVSTPARISAERAVPLAATADDEPESQAIVTELSKPRALRFAHKPLKDVVEQIKGLTRGKSDTAIPICFDPPDSQDVQKAKATLVTVDLDNVPLRTTLRLLLAQAGMESSIRKGFLIITKSKESVGMMGQMMRGMMAGSESDRTKGSPSAGGMMGGGETTSKADNAAKGAWKSRRSMSKTGKPASAGRE